MEIFQKKWSTSQGGPRNWLVLLGPNGTYCFISKNSCFLFYLAVACVADVT